MAIFAPGATCTVAAVPAATVIGSWARSEEENVTSAAKR